MIRVSAKSQSFLLQILAIPGDLVPEKAVSSLIGGKYQIARTCLALFENATQAQLVPNPVGFIILIVK